MSESYTTGTGQVVRQVHPEDACKGESCPIHNPSNHIMSDFPTNFRDETGLMERICPCGVGHPDPDSLAFFERAGVTGLGVHGCCSHGCCVNILESDGEWHVLEDE